MVDPVDPSTVYDSTADTVDVETLFNVAMEAHNLYVEEHFGQIEAVNPQDPLLELKGYSLIQPNDSFIEVLIRFWSFYVLVGKAAFFSPPIYGIPTDAFQETVKFKPQVKLHFREILSEVEPGYQPVRAEISFRIMKVPEAEITPALASSWAIKIKELFAVERFSFRKGWTKVTYKDFANGYDFYLFVSSLEEGIRVIEQVLEIQGDAFDETKIVQHSSQATFPAVPPNALIYGQERRQPRRRPVATVQFMKAELKIWGLPNDVVLIDLTGRSRNPLA